MSKSRHDRCRYCNKISFKQAVFSKDCIVCIMSTYPEGSIEKEKYAAIASGLKKGKASSGKMHAQGMPVQVANPD
jgi:hypothetical protein